MRYLTISIVVALTMLFISACQEESQPVAEEAPKVIAQEKKVAASADETAENNAEKVVEHIKEEGAKAVEHAQEQAHKLMEKANERKAEQGGMVPATFSVETLATGKMVFEQTCAACHATGLAGAPKIGDKVAWRAYIEEGFDDMVESAINGKGAMPAKGGNAILSHGEIKAAVSYIIEQSQ